MMVLTEKHDRAEDARANRALIEVVTENGFSIVRSCGDDEIVPGGAGEYRFIVSHLDGLECEVIVEFDPAAVWAIQRKRRIPLSPDNSFWIGCAERSLAMYLWEKSHLPPDGKLKLEEICLAELEIARRWEREMTPPAELRPQNILRARIQID